MKVVGGLFWTLRICLSKEKSGVKSTASFCALLLRLCVCTHSTFKGYLRFDGRAGIRNEIWIIPTVGCVNGFCRDLAAEFSGKEVYAFTHEAGCSQCGSDQENTEKLLAGLVRHPNAGGVLIVSLGCENNVPEKFFKLTSRADERVKLLVLQSASDEKKRRRKAYKTAYRHQKNRQKTGYSAFKAYGRA